MSTIPQGVKMPADRQAKKNEANPDNTEDIVFAYGEDGDGQPFEYVIPADAFDDVEIVELLEDEKNISVLRQILGKEQWDLWKDRSRGATGRVSSATAMSFLQAMFAAVGQGNSSASSTS